MTMTDPEVHALTGAYACDALTPAEAAAFEQHLAVCPTCAQEVDELRETVARLAMAVAEPPPPGLRAAVDARIAVTRQLAPHIVPGARLARERRRRLTQWIGWGVAAGMACAVALLGVRVADQQRQIDQGARQSQSIERLLAAPDARIASADVTTGGHAMVTVSRSQDEAAIAIVGLTAAPPGHAYQLWMIGPSGTRSGGLLPIRPGGTSGSVIAHGLGDAEKIGLTVEPAQGSAPPTTTPVLLMPMPA
jgi:anti-sigma-K factor RskA